MSHCQLFLAVLFKIQDLSIDGEKANPEGRLSDLLSLGDALFCYCKSLVPSKIVGSTAIGYVAAQVKE